MKRDKQSIIEERFDNVSASKTFYNMVRYLNLNEKSVLDIGCSYGEFLIHFGRGSIGLTISHEEVNYGKNKGLEIRYGNIESEDLSLKEKFDVIFANNIFEHLYSPHRFLINCKNLLKPGGILVLGVPCIPTLSFLLHLTKFRGSLAVSHINFFTRETLVKTVERAGWNIENIRSFHFKNSFCDRLLDIISPHFYVVAVLDRNFSYHEKRQEELKGYEVKI